ncbi:hypothetical protein SJAG_05750 [Schizosaccharomyces japonicus yFS275]|uniref:Uncharacterized protein n=1 Tax=Schizosaccharomyces japonicus (strain yFS275 / FY16936) TaxID=402676 RepID=T0RST6_SCHJY|nr:hypothetical protein SJAG_05750 [Schizosaccharomyces japonicus yFS275]EQC52995.1 hypothetical protein SJAG_05750 [Schizosaccharomyces japonicus yFS275]
MRCFKHRTTRCFHHCVRTMLAISVSADERVFVKGICGSKYVYLSFRTPVLSRLTGCLKAFTRCTTKRASSFCAAAGHEFMRVFFLFFFLFFCIKISLFLINCLNNY